ncbi:hypothetical protein WJX73_007239 [Symbiochloris irregularis]|uniref:Uncharacterized protein n=1 Tax=Symbiochloris irregularis TaxID=706552 RepID=A0AAW1P191_9CHLO
MEHSRSCTRARGETVPPHANTWHGSKEGDKQNEDQPVRKKGKPATNPAASRSRPRSLPPPIPLKEASAVDMEGSCNDWLSTRQRVRMERWSSRRGLMNSSGHIVSDLGPAPLACKIRNRCTHGL